MVTYPGDGLVTVFENNNQTGSVACQEMLVFEMYERLCETVKSIKISNPEFNLDYGISPKDHEHVPNALRIMFDDDHDGVTVYYGELSKQYFLIRNKENDPLISGADLSKIEERLSSMLVEHCKKKGVTLPDSPSSVVDEKPFGGDGPKKDFEHS